MLRQTAINGSTTHSVRHASPWHRKHPDFPMIRRVLANNSLEPHQTVTSCRWWEDTHDQTVWSFPREARDLQGLSVTSVEIALTDDEIQAFDNAKGVEPNHPAELLQQLITFRVLYAFGGIVVDPAVLWMWRPLPIVDDFLFVQEGAGSISTSLLGMPPGTGLAKQLAEECSALLRGKDRLRLPKPIGGARLAELTQGMGWGWMVCPETLFPTMPVFPLTIDSPFLLPEGHSLSFEAPLQGHSNVAPLQGHPLLGVIAVRIGHPQDCWEEETKLLHQLNPTSKRRMSEGDLYADIAVRHLAWLSARTNPARAMTILADVWSHLQLQGHKAEARRGKARPGDSKLENFLTIADDRTHYTRRDAIIADLLQLASAQEAKRTSTAGSEMTASIRRTCEAFADYVAAEDIIPPGTL